MKHSTLVLLIISFSISAFGQSYIPFEMSVGTYWRTYSYNCCYNALATACTAEHYSEVISDTIIANKKYYKIKKGYLANNGSGNCLPNNYNVIHYLREDTLSKKIYSRTWTGQDTLIMDFSQQIGDTCNLFDLNFAQYFVVTDIDSILINSVYHRRINYGNGAFSLIEGIGCTLGITELWFDFENETTLTCKGKSGINQYPDTISNPISCSPVLNLGINNKEQQLKLSVFPNPSQSVISCSLQDKKIVYAAIYDLVGNLAINENYFNSSVVIDISKILNGLYYLILTDEDGVYYYRKILKQ